MYSTTLGIELVEWERQDIPSNRVTSRYNLHHIHDINLHHLHLPGSSRDHTIGNSVRTTRANYPTYPNIGLRRGLTSWKIEPIRDFGHQNSFLSILRSNHSSFKRLQGICLQEKHKERKHVSASNVQLKTTNPSSFRGETAGTPTIINPSGKINIINENHRKIMGFL